MTFVPNLKQATIQNQKLFFLDQGRTNLFRVRAETGQIFERKRFPVPTNDLENILFNIKI